MLNYNTFCVCSAQPKKKKKKNCAVVHQRPHRLIGFLSCRRMHAGSRVTVRCDTTRRLEDCTTKTHTTKVTKWDNVEREKKAQENNFITLGFMRWRENRCEREDKASSNLSRGLVYKCCPGNTHTHLFHSCMLTKHPRPSTQS